MDLRPFVSDLLQYDFYELNFLPAQKPRRLSVTAAIVHTVQPTVHKIAQRLARSPRIVTIFLKFDHPISPARNRSLAQERIIVPED
jgi:hypothetical protein